MNKKNKLIVLISGIIGILVLVIGISYSVFNFNKSGTNQQLILGDIWMKYSESDTSIQIANATPQKLLASDFVAKGYLNPIMKNQTLTEANELDKCVKIFNNWWWSAPELDEGVTTIESYCKGTGKIYDYTLQDEINDWSKDEYFLEDVGQELLDANIIIPTDNSYLVNPVMANQSLSENLNQLSTCVLELSFIKLDENENYESFCKVEGTIQGLTYKEHSAINSELYIETYNSFLDNNIIIDDTVLLDVDLPYFEFTISGKNTYEKEDIKYEIVLNNSEYNGIDKDIRNERILDKFLKFSLVEIVDNETFLRFHNRSYEELTNKTVFTETISNEDGDFNRTYRLYMWIGDEVIIGGGDSIYDYDMATWNEKVYASVRVDVNGDFVDKNISNEYIPATDIASFKRLVNNNFQDTVVVDTDGTVYLSGSNEDVNYNYVWYSGKLWRITAINPDGTMKMITQNNITTIAYGIDDSKFYVNDNEKSYVYQWLNEDFLDTLYNYENIINVNSSWNVTPNNSSMNATSCPEYDTVISISPPKNSSEGAVIVKSNVGLLNSYEYYKTYENFGIYNYSNSYLNDGYDWWLVNQLVTLENRESIWKVNKEGRVASSLTTMNEGVRPVINLKSNVEFYDGTGTFDNPYKIKGDNEKIVFNTTELNTRSSGEYVIFDNDLYRIVEIQNKLTKLVKMDYVRNENNEVLLKKFASANSYIYYGGTGTNSEDYWAGYLNDIWYNNITMKYKSMLGGGIYYLGSTESSNSHYKKTICEVVNDSISIKECIKTSNVWTGKVGLLRYGEMFSVVTKEMRETSVDMWLISPHIYYTYAKWIDCLRSNGDTGSVGSSDALFAARPTITLSSDVYITSGDGTEQNPFEIAMRIPEAE